MSTTQSLVDVIQNFVSGLGKTKNTGGGFASGGRISGAGTGTSDSIHAMVSHGEYIVNAKSTSRFLPLLHAINGFAGGGLVEWASQFAPLKFASGGMVDWASKQGGAIGAIYAKLSEIYAASQYTPRSEIYASQSDIYAPDQHTPRSEIYASPSDIYAPDQHTKQSDIHASQSDIYAGSQYLSNSDIYAPQFAAGGLVDMLSQFTLPKLADGGMVGLGAADLALPQFSLGGLVDGLRGSIDIPGFASGGRVNTAELATAGAGPTQHFGTVDFRTDGGTVSGAVSHDFVKSLSRAAVDRSIRSGGPKPSHFR
jgi:hypothetical protein